MSPIARCATVALSSVVLGAASGCLIYNEDLLVSDGGGGSAGDGGSQGGGGSGGCAAACGHVLISEFAVTPTDNEFLEIFNPLNAAIELDDVYLADFPDYYLVASGTPTIGGTDFLVRFPPGTEIPPGGRLVVALTPAISADFSAEEMPGTFTPGTSGFTNENEMLILFEWDGTSATVRDLDYVIWGETSDAVDKSGVAGYSDDTPAAEQRRLAPPGSMMSQHRCDLDEPGERTTEGNGVDGHDETSENLPASFRIGSTSPGSSPGAGVCP